MRKIPMNTTNNASSGTLENGFFDLVHLKASREYPRVSFRVSMRQAKQVWTVRPYHHRALAIVIGVLMCTAEYKYDYTMRTFT